MSARPQFRPHLGPLLLLLAIVYGALGVWVHAGRSWQGDELGSYLAFRADYRHLLTYFGGWQTMNFYLAALKAIYSVRGGANWLLVLPGLAAGMLLVLIVAGIVRAVGGSRSTALIAALLTSVNPFLLEYGVTIRSYIFLATFSAAMVWALLRWKATGGWRDGVLCGVSGGLALLAHLNA